MFVILVQVFLENRCKFIVVDVIDIMFQFVVFYWRWDFDKGSEEEEYMENLFEVLICLVDEFEGKFKFIEVEGFEFCFIMFKDGKMSKVLFLWFIDYVVGGEGFCLEVCQKFVEVGGLKILFIFFNKF